MRKFIIGAAGAVSALTFAAPASAQIVPWAPPVYTYTPYNYGYGFSNMRFAQTMQARVERIRADIRVMHARRVLSRSEARSLDRQARNLQVRIARASSFGINPYEARSLENQIFRLQRRVAQEANDWDRRYGRHRRY